MSIMIFLSIFLSFLGAALCKPDIITPHGNFSTDPISPADREYLLRHAQTTRADYTGFHFMYVNQQGHIVADHKPSGNYITVVGSPRVTHDQLYKAALETGHMLMHSPSHIFNNIANTRNSGVGVFTASEKLTVFPEYAHMANVPACHGRCDGNCKQTCTFDGRKFEDIAGVTGTRSVVLVDNVMCDSHDPYHRHDNILVHEFGHSVEMHGMDSSEKQQNINAYNNAKSHNLWQLSSYAMANHYEYFAEATGAYFLVNLQSTTGGMNHCHGHTCRSVTEVRTFLHSHDSRLATLLDHIYFNGRPSDTHQLSIC